jgi:hypothetical protein
VSDSPKSVISFKGADGLETSDSSLSVILGSTTLLFIFSFPGWSLTFSLCGFLV